MMRYNRILVAWITVMMTAFVVVFCTLPRSTYSELERRDLLRFPKFSWGSLRDGSFTQSVSNWFSDSEPFRDVFMSGSMELKSLMAFKTQSAVTFHAAQEEPVAIAETPSEVDLLGDQRDIEEFHNNVDANAKMESAGVIVVGNAPDARALMAFKNKNKGEKSYATTVNRYQKLFGSDVNVYCMIIPTAVEYYCPMNARSCTDPEFPVLTELYDLIDTTVQVVDLYDLMGEHVDEDIYLRTDHHWSPLGAYYAARQFAMVAGVKVPELKDFESDTIKNYVGSMYGFSKDVNVKKSPEDFVFYKPLDVEYETTYIKYDLDEEFRITGEEKPRQGEFFVKTSGTGSAYCTFMGSDARITQVRTNADCPRRLLVMKDSFGNAIPGYLFGSFSEIHVIDFRYFTYNIKDYITEHGITDILMANNISHVCSGAIGSAYKKFLEK
ncbi:MAG: hypothetical protein J6X40_02480 [Bacteroidales bacterium]|nr:hypothetical protein [Bacteroidales bacterium]